MSASPAGRRYGVRLAAAVAGALLTLVTLLFATRLYGSGLSPDSVAYTATARHIAGGVGVVSYDNTPLVDQPPLYPALLAVVSMASGRDPLECARWANALLAALTVALAAALLWPRLHSDLLFATGVGLVAVARPLFAVSSYSLSEPLFVLLCTLFLLVADRYAAGRGAARIALWAGVAALATMTRYVGVALIATGGLLLLLERGRSWRQRLAQAALFGAVACAPVALWLARNYQIAGSLMGPRQPARTGLADALGYTLATLGGWLFARDDLADLPESLRSLWRMMAAPFASAAAPVLAALAAVAVPAPDRGARPQAAWPLSAPPALLSAIYLALLLYTSTTILYDRIGDRLLAPLFIPLLLLALAALDGWAHAGGRLRRGRLAAAAAVALSLLIAAGGATLVHAEKAAERGAGGYARRSWQESPMVLALRAQPPPAGATLYTNAPDAVYLFIDRQSRLPPRRDVYNRGATPALLEALRGEWPPEGSALLLWFDEQERAYLLTPGELAGAASVRAVEQFEDGAIYAVEKLE